MPANLLYNGGFENEFHLYRGKSALLVADGWTPWWVDQQRPPDPSWKNRRPEWKRATLEVDAARIRSGESAQQYFSFWGTHIGGVYQRVMVPRNARLRFSAWGHAWSSEQNAPRPSVNPTNMHMRIGLDPKGGVDPFDPGIVWSAEQSAIDQYAPFAVEAVAQGGRVTAFFYSAPDEPKKHQNVYWDDAELIAVGGDPNAPRDPNPDATITIAPAQPAPGAAVTVSARSATALTFVGLRVVTPGGATAIPPYQGDRREGSQFVWEWTYTPSAAGQYQAVFLADGIAPAWTAVPVGVQPSPPPPQPTPPPTPPPTTPRGRPRADYKRTYLLLPNFPATPTGNQMLAQWFAAVVRSGVLEKFRWTIGTSADDAGIGDLSVRRVIAVNPATWGASLSAFYQQYYPGVEYRAVEANTPAELESILVNWSG
jgi:hypothetical protein